MGGQNCVHEGAKHPVADVVGVCGYGSGRVDASRVRVYPLLPVKKVPKSHVQLLISFVVTVW